jgi:hypothetical protein
MDFVITLKNTVFAIECKSGFTPGLSRGNYNAIEDIAPKHVFVVSPIVKGWKMKQGIDFVSLDELEIKIKEMI